MRAGQDAAVAPSPWVSTCVHSVAALHESLPKPVLLTNFQPTVDGCAAAVVDGLNKG